MDVRKVKKDIIVNVHVDSREQDVRYVKELIDSRITKDGIKIVSTESICVKPMDVNTGLPCKISTGDIGFSYKIKDSDDDWILSSFCAEIKKSTDCFGSLYMASNKLKLMNEIDRAKSYGLDFKFLVTDNVSDISKAILKIQKFRNTNAHVTHFENMLKLDDKLRECNFGGVIVTGTDLAWVLKRLIKSHIIKNKLQYF